MSAIDDVDFSEQDDESGYPLTEAPRTHAVATNVRSTWATAVSVQRPRQLAQIKSKLLEEARLMGEDAYYGWGAGKNAIEGPSIDLAVAAARCWGNCATEFLPVQETEDSWYFTAAFIDLETGYTRTRQFRQSKQSTVSGKMDEERKTDIRFQVGQSKAERNVILKALPKWLINAAMDEAKKGVRQKIEKYVKDNGIARAIDVLLRELAKVGIKEAQVLAKCNLAEARGLTVDHLVILRGDLQAIQSGQETADALFPAMVEHAKPEGNGKQAELPAKELPTEKPTGNASRRKMTTKQRQLLEEKIKTLGKTWGDLCEQVQAEFNVATPQDLTESQAHELLQSLQSAVDAAKAAPQPAETEL